MEETEDPLRSVCFEIRQHYGKHSDLFKKMLERENVEKAFRYHYLLTCDDECEYLLKCHGKFDAPMMGITVKTLDGHTKEKIDKFLKQSEPPLTTAEDTSSFIVMDFKSDGMQCISTYLFL